jgi:hypothetical protein
VKPTSQTNSGFTQVAGALVRFLAKGTIGLNERRRLTVGKEEETSPKPAE